MNAAGHLFDKAEVRHVQAFDATLALRVFGQGPAMVLLHGWPLDGFTWRFVLPRLAQCWTCYVIDSAGLGASDWSDGTDFSFAAHARRVKELMEALGIGSYNLLAHNTGATVARILADSVPDRVQRVCLINTEMPGHRPPWIPLYRYVMRLPGALTIFRRLLAIRPFRDSNMAFGGCFNDPHLLNGEFYEHNVAPVITSQRRAEGAICYLLGIDWHAVDGMRAIHGRLSIPTALIWGEDDRTFPLKLAQKMAEEFAVRPEFFVIQGARLLPHEEKPDAVLAAIMSFLTTGQPP